VADDLKVEPGRIEAGAGGDEDMRDAAAFGRREREAVEGFIGEAWCGLLEDLHALGGRREAAAGVELVCVDVEFVGDGDGGEHGEAALDAGAGGHAAEEITDAVLLQHVVGKGDEGVVHVVAGDGGGNTVEVRGGHGALYTL